MLCLVSCITATSTVTVFVRHVNIRLKSQWYSTGRLTHCRSKSQPSAWWIYQLFASLATRLHWQKCQFLKNGARVTHYTCCECLTWRRSGKARPYSGFAKGALAMEPPIPGLLFALLLLTGMLALLELGRRFGVRRRPKESEGERGGLGTVEGAGFALVGLMMSFTFSGAAARL